MRARLLRNLFSRVVAWPRNAWNRAVGKNIESILALMCLISMLGFFSSFLLKVSGTSITIMCGGLIAAAFSYLTIELNKEIKLKSIKEDRCKEIEHRCGVLFSRYISVVQGHHDVFVKIVNIKKETDKKVFDDEEFQSKNIYPLAMQAVKSYSLFVSDMQILRKYLQTTGRIFEDLKQSCDKVGNNIILLYNDLGKGIKPIINNKEDMPEYFEELDAQRVNAIVDGVYDIINEELSISFKRVEDNSKEFERKSSSVLFGIVLVVFFALGYNVAEGWGVHNEYFEVVTDE